MLSMAWAPYHPSAVAIQQVPAPGWQTMTIVCPPFPCLQRIAYAGDAVDVPGGHEAAAAVDQAVGASFGGSGEREVFFTNNAQYGKGTDHHGVLAFPPAPACLIPVKKLCFHQH